MKTGQRSEGHHQVIQLLAAARVDIGTQLVKGTKNCPVLPGPLAQEVRKISKPIKPRSSQPDLTLAEGKYRNHMMKGLGDAVR